MNPGGYVTNMYQIWFDQNYGHEKIILYNNGNVLTNYSLGVHSNTCNAPMGFSKNFDVFIFYGLFAR